MSSRPTNTEPVRIRTELTNQVLWVRVDRPAQHNALSQAMLEDIGTAFNDHRDVDSIKLAVLTGTGTASFAAGGDLIELDAVRTQAQTEAMTDRGMRCLNAIRDFPQPVVAALNGAARGGGAELALACDLRVAAAHCRFGLIQGRLNLATAWGGGTDLLHLQSPSQALLTLGRAELLSAEQALAHGLVDAVLPDPEPPLDFATQVSNFLEPLLARPRQVLQAHKRLICAAQNGANRSALQTLESADLVATWTHPDHWQAAATALPGSAKEP